MYSFNVEHARGDWNNMVAIFMKHHSLDIQGAVNRTAEMCCQVFDTFNENKAKLPSWGPEIDKDVSLYVGGLESWMSGNLYWSFTTERYFGPEVLDIKQNKVVKLLL
jgi:alpha-muurolene/germacrene-A/gamma-muurolene/(+)-delta-cadinol synthase